MVRVLLGDVWPCVRCDAGLRSRASSSFPCLRGSRTWQGWVCNCRKARPLRSITRNQCRCTLRHTPTGIAERLEPGIRVKKGQAIAAVMQHRWNRSRGNVGGNPRARVKVHAMLVGFGIWQLLTEAFDASFSPWQERALGWRDRLWEANPVSSCFWCYLVKAGRYLWHRLQPRSWESCRKQGGRRVCVSWGRRVAGWDVRASSAIWNWRISIRWSKAAPFPPYC